MYTKTERERWYLTRLYKYMNSLSFMKMEVNQKVWKRLEISAKNAKNIEDYEKI